MINTFLGIFLALSPLIQGVEPCEDKSSARNPAVVMAEEILETFKVNHWSASSDDIEKSPCRGKVLSLKKLRQENDKLLDGPKTKERSIVGARFENESEQMLRMFDLLVQKRRFSGEGYILPDQKDYSHLTSGSCKKVRCALNQLFGEEYSENAMYLLSKYELNVSPIGLGNDKTKKFSPDELKSIHQSVTDLPKDLFPIQVAKSLRRSSLDGGNTLGNATIMFFDGFKKYNHHEKAGICAHEFAHNFSNLGNLDESPEWLNISGWIDNEGKWEREPSTDNRFVSKYAKGNPAEDFAESVVAYRYNPEGLRAASVEKYNFIKELVFKGREYTAAGDRACQGQTSFEKDFERKLNKLFLDTNIENEELLFDQSVVECSKEVMDRFTGGSKEELAKCLKKITQKKLIGKNWEQVKEEFKYPDKAKELIDKNFYKLDVNISEDYLDRYVGNLDKEFQKIERNAMTEVVKMMNLYRKFTDAKTIDEFCQDDIVKYSYQKFKELEKGLKPFYLYNNKAEINKKVMKVCKSVFKNMNDLKREVKLSDVL